MTGGAGAMKFMSKHFTLLYTEPELTLFSTINDERFAGLTERHKIELRITRVQRTRDLFAELVRSQAAGVVIRIPAGWCSLSCLRFSGKVLRAGRKVWFYWANEQAIECIDHEHLRSYWRLWSIANLHKYLVRPLNSLTTGSTRLRPTTQDRFGLSGRDLARDVKFGIECCVAVAQPVPIAAIRPRAVEQRITGTGTYLQMDFRKMSTSLRHLH